MVPSIVTFALALAIVLLILKVLGKSLKILIGVIVNALIGFVVLTVLKICGIAVAVNWLSALIVGLLGIPGLIIVLVLQLGFQMLL